MNGMEVDFYEVGIKDANEAKHIVSAYASKRYASLSKQYRLKIGKESVKAVKAYDKGVAYEINRQTRLEG